MTEAERKLLVWCAVLHLKSTPLVSSECDDIETLIAAVRDADSAAAATRRDAEIARLLAVLEAARCIQHWHDHMIGQDEGMVVSAEHVRRLWVAIAAYDALPQPR